MIGSGITAWLLFDITSCTVFPRGGALCRFSLRRSNLSSIAYEFCFRTMLYMLFSSLFAPCIPRLARNSWKLDNALGCQAWGGNKGIIRGIGIYPTIWGAWKRSGCSGLSATWFVTPCTWGEVVDWSLLERQHWRQRLCVLRQNE